MIQKLEKEDLLRKKIYKILKKAIIEGEMAPGEKLVETRLAEKLGVSRTPLREAIRLLESEGYLKNISSGGVKVKEISLKEIQDWADIKSYLDELSVIKAIDNISQKELNKLEEILEKIAEELDKENYQKVANLNSEFHKTIIIASGNEMLNTISKDYQNYSIILRNYLANLQDRNIQAYSEHKEIYKTIKNKNKGKARKLIEKHSENSKKALIKYLEKLEKTN